MARSAASKDHRRRYYRFQGRKGFREFLRQHCTITHRRTDVVRRHDLYRAYRRFCAAAHHPVASVVNVGRYLGDLQVWASKRLGGSNGRRQEYAYVGLCLQESPPRTPQEGPLTPPALPSLNTDPPSPSPGISPPQCDDSLGLFDAFLREHVERTGSAEDAVPMGELHAAYRRQCRERGITPMPTTNLISRLARREGVVVSRLNFETVKRAYQGLRWTRAALVSLTPSRRPRPTPCDFCEAGRSSLAASEGVKMAGDEVGLEAGTSGDWSPWAEDGDMEVQLSLKYWNDDDSEGHFQTLQTASLPLQPTVVTPPTPADQMLLQSTVDLAHLLEDYNSTDTCIL